MSKEKAFPKPDIELPGGIQYGSEGMDLRDYFAAKAMQGLSTRMSAQGDQLGDEFSRNMDKLAEYSYQIADAMIKAREK